MEEIKKQAVYQTLLIIAAIVMCSLVFNVIVMYTPVQVLKAVFGIGLVAFLVYAIYGVVLSRLQYDETLKKINDSSEKSVDIKS
jgi:hypothetical protein